MAQSSSSFYNFGILLTDGVDLKVYLRSEARAISTNKFLKDTQQELIHRADWERQFKDEL